MAWGKVCPQRRVSSSDEDVLAPELVTRHALTLNPGALSHYVDPVAYRTRYKGRAEDVDFYRRVSRRAGGEVLEYGCGNGRVTLELARAGVRVTAVDASPFMLADLKRQLRAMHSSERARVRTMRGDMRSLGLSRRFRLVIMPFNVFGHLYDRNDVELLLGRVRRHLLPGGRLVFDVYQPRMSELSGALNGHFYDSLSQILTLTFDADPPSVLTLRQFFPAELRMLLEYNGFHRIRMTSDFEGAPLDEDTTSIVVSASLVG